MSASNSPKTNRTQIPPSRTTVPVLVLLGATGVGKTAALRTLDPEAIEIVSADSRQVYRGMDIGTAKPSPRERLRPVHHLIDVVDPDEPWDVGAFLRSADRITQEIAGRGRLPVVSGGTAFYVRAYLYGLPETPKAGPELRGRIERRLRAEGLNSLRSELRKVDPEADATIAANDAYRVVRALEIYYAAGRPRSAFRVPEEIRAGIEPYVVGLHRPRPELYARIDRRVEEMFAGGLPAEVERLCRAGYGPNDPGMNAIGYREFFEVAGDPPWHGDDLARVRALIQRNSRRYAKRQDTFFRRFAGVRWVHADVLDEQAEILDILRRRAYTHGL